MTLSRFFGLFLYLLAVCLAANGQTQTPSVPAAKQADKSGDGYEYFVVGNPADASRKTSPGALLMGGGTDVAAAFQWLIGKAGGGDIVVLRASGTDAYNPYINKLGAVDSVETLIVKSRAAAADDFVVNKVRNAEAIFIAGGAQSNYVKFWQGTPLADAVNQAVAKGVPIGGTSAGLAILGEFSFPALGGSATSAEALANPFVGSVTLARDFLRVPGLQGVITDSHFVERDRMGRLLTFLARLAQDGWVKPQAKSVSLKGIGIDRETALLVEADGTISVRGKNAAYFISVSSSPEICRANTPLTFRRLSVFKLAGEGTFSLKNWQGQSGASYTISVENGGLVSSTGSVY